LETEVGGERKTPVAITEELPHKCFLPRHLRRKEKLSFLISSIPSVDSRRLTASSSSSSFILFHTLLLSEVAVRVRRSSSPKTYQPREGKKKKEEGETTEKHVKEQVGSLLVDE
jgi:hypothetical protein